MVTHYFTGEKYNIDFSIVIGVALAKFPCMTFKSMQYFKETDS
jgi:hypothetical protein